MILSHCDTCCTYTQSDFNDNCRTCGRPKDASQHREATKDNDRPRANWSIDWRVPR